MINKTLWKHQKDMLPEVLKGLKEYGSFYILGGCSIGKTLLSLATRYELPDVQRTLIVTTKAALYTAWVSEIEDSTNSSYVVLDKGTKKNQELVKKDYDFYITNYEALWRIKNLPDFDMHIVDECHKLQGVRSKQSKFLASLPGRYKLAMTGTGWEDRHAQLYGQMRYLFPATYGRCLLFGNYRDFIDDYCEYYTKDNIPRITGSKNTDLLAKRIEPFMITVLTEDVVSLPELRTIEYKIGMPSKTRKKYRELLTYMITEVNDSVVTASNVLVKTSKLRQLANGYINTDNGYEYIADNPKLSQALAIIDSLDGKPVVIFTNYKEDVTQIATALDKEGISYSKLTGDTKQHNDWIAGNGGQVLICNYAAGSAGVNLSRARFGIDYTPTYSNTDYIQSRYRLRRVTSDLAYPVTFYRLIIDDSIESVIWRAIEKKNDTATALLSYLK